MATLDREYASQWREQNRDHIREYARKWREQNRERMREHQARYAAAHPDRVKASKRRWEESNPQKRRDRSARRRARLASAPRVECIDRIAVYEREGGRCHICNRRVSIQKFELDHLVPIAAGGEHTSSNVRLAHRSCNARRGVGRIPAQLLLVA